MNWVPITEAQPEEGQKVIAKTLPICAALQHKELITFRKDGKDMVMRFGATSDAITHWKPVDRLCMMLHRANECKSISGMIRLYDSVLKDAPPEVRAWLESEAKST